MATATARFSSTTGPRARRASSSYSAAIWIQIAALYEELALLALGPVVELNRAVAVAMADGPSVGLAIVEQIAASGALETYPWLHSARADLLRRVGRFEEAAQAYARARELITNPVDRAFLDRRLAEVSGAR